jgi:phosphonate transport system substrate-binding protein
MTDTLLLGAVAYDPKVVIIWDGFQRWFRARDLPLDYVLYTNYERQVAQHFAGAVHVAWNSPLAWLQAEHLAAPSPTSSPGRCRADSPVRTIADLRQKRLGVGAADSPQATMLPLEHLAAHGLLADRDFAVQRYDVLLGKHGDHVGGERDAAKALMAGSVDAACMIDGNHLLFTQEGTLGRGQTRVLAQTAPYDHCNFTVLDGAPEPLIARFTDLLLGMRYDDPEVRPLLDLEGLKAWRPGRTSGYRALASACDRFGFLQPFLRQMEAE